MSKSKYYFLDPGNKFHHDEREEITQKNNPIERIEITKLHGHRNFCMELNQPYKILLSENGQGKTTILKIMNAALSANVHSLKQLNFESIKIKFQKADPIFLLKESLEYEPDSPACGYISRKMDRGNFEKIIKIAYDKKLSKLARRHKIEAITAETGTHIASAAIRDLLEESEASLFNVEKIEFFQKVKDNFTYTPLYLPTYRRVEDDLSALGLSGDILEKESIKFGLADVEEKLSAIRKDILTTSIESMTRINGEILTRLVNGLQINDADKANIKNNANQIELVLRRVGHSLSERDKSKIVELVKSENLFGDSRHEALVYFLSQMFKVFADQRRSDEALSAFAEICTTYFVNKKMIYDERDLAVKIYCTDSGSEIELRHLSSGEKQIVSLFSKLYLDQNKIYAILFDEPELSLSVEWQKKIIHDVITAGSCGLLIAMTHSPFIFTGLSKYTSDLRMYFN